MRKGIRFLLTLGVLMAGVMVSPRLFAEDYTIDKSHSTVGFTTTHLMVSRVPGQFNDYDGTISFDANNLDASKINVTVQAASIDTRNEKRDGHLKSPDFFDAAQFPTITFVSKKIVKEGDVYNVTGDLTIKGVTKEVIFPTSIVGPVNNPFGGTAIGVNTTAKINRQDYGVTWNKTLDNGGVMVSDVVDLNISFEANKQ